MNETIRRKRLYYQSGYRGTKELDILLGKFAQHALDGLSLEELTQYEALLEVPETDLFNWLVGIEPVAEEFNTPLFAKMRKVLGA